MTIFSRARAISIIVFFVAIYLAFFPAHKLAAQAKGKTVVGGHGVDHDPSILTGTIRRRITPSGAIFSSLWPNTILSRKGTWASWRVLVRH